MKISNSSKFQIMLGKKIYGNPESMGIPCSAEEFYANPSDRVAIQPLLHVDAVKEDENMKRALIVNTLRLDATRQISIFTIPFMLAVYLAFVVASGSIKPTNPLQAMATAMTGSPTTNNVEQVSSSSIGSYTSSAFSWIKVHTLGYIQSDETKLARSKELNAKLQNARSQFEMQEQLIKQSATSKEDLINKLHNYESSMENNMRADLVEFASLHGDARIGLEKVKQDAEVLKQQFANGSITQQQFDEQKAKILEDQKKYQDQLK